LWPQKTCDWNIAVYILNIVDMLIPYQIQDPSSEEVFFRNAGSAQNQGVEARFQWMPIEGLKASFAYTFMNFKFTDFVVETSSGNMVERIQLAGNKVPGVSPHHLFVGIAYEHSSAAYTELNLQWVDKYFANDFNGPPPGSAKPIQDFINDAYLTVDARLGLQRRFKKIGVDLFLGVNNFFDKRYNSSIVPNAQGDRFFEPAPGRSWYVGVNVPFPTRTSRNQKENVFWYPDFTNYPDNSANPDTN
jgi:iron complex outermembrane receptor protein